MVFRSNHRNLAWLGFKLTHGCWIMFIYSNRQSYQALILTRTQSPLCTVSPILAFFQFSGFILVIAFILSQWKSCTGNHMSVAKGIDTYGIHNWMVFGRSYSQVEQNLSPLPVNSVRTQSKLCKVTPVSPFFQG